MNYTNHPRYSKEEFIRKAITVHGNKYDYSPVEYIRSNCKTIIKCPEHGIFSQIPAAHLSGQGCPTCGRISTITKNRISQEEYLNKAI
jgi:hypothetical protein